MRNILTIKIVPIPHQNSDDSIYHHVEKTMSLTLARYALFCPRKDFLDLVTEISLFPNLD